MKKLKNKPKEKIITVQPTQAAIVPADKEKAKLTPRQIGNLNLHPHGGNKPVGARTRSVLDIALENFLMEEVVPRSAGKSKKRMAREPRMRALIRAIYIQAIKGTGKGRLAELIFERVGGKPGQTVYTEEFSASYSDPELRKRRIKELQKSLKVRIST